jgi:MFS family permease
MLGSRLKHMWRRGDEQEETPVNLHSSSVAPAKPATAARVSRAYAWLVFALTFALMLSDYTARQALTAVFPLLKVQWQISDTRLGALSSVVPLTVGILTFPISVIADRWGRVRSIAIMAALWSLATLVCALATSYGEMFVARFFVGVGEAAYGSVGLAVILGIFPKHLRGTLTGAFTSGAPFGSVLGVSLSGLIAARYGWRYSIGAMAIAGFALVLIYYIVVTERKLARIQSRPMDDIPTAAHARPNLGNLFRSLFPTPSAGYAYLACGLQLFIQGTLLVWLPSYLNRYFGMPLSRAALAAAGLVLVSAIGQVVCGIVTDRISRHAPARRWHVAIGYCLLLGTLLFLAFRLPPGSLQIALVAAGVFFAASSLATSGAIIADATPPAFHASAFAALTLLNNIIGLASGPVLTGLLADAIGLRAALQWVPLAALLPLAACLAGKRAYVAERRRAAGGRA